MSMKRVNAAIFAMLLAALATSAAEWPYAVYLDGRAQAFALETAGNEQVGTASVGWTSSHLIVNATVRDATPVSLADVGVSTNQAYLADSVEFWVGRHQFVAVETSQGGQLWDYLYQRPVDGADVTVAASEEGYRLRIAVPWGELQLSPTPGASFPFLLQINDRQRVKDGEAWKASGRQLVFPASATWDQVSTYATVFLASEEVHNTLPAPAPFASLEIRQRAYAKSVEAVIRRQPEFAAAALRLVCRAPDGTVLSEQSLPSGSGAILMQLAWDDKLVGICTAELWLETASGQLGPVAEPYFCAGTVQIAEHRSPRQAPDDLAAFWAKKVAAMRARPMNATVSEQPSTRSDVIVEKVTFDNHRGLPMVVWVTHKRADSGPRRAHLNVYPPMHADTHVWPQSGQLGVTFCGSRQGECRLPGQATNEVLWARADSLDECYWLDVVLDGVLAMDYVASRPDSNGQVVLSGGSRGGWYTLALAAVAPDRVAFARFTSPCYSDVTMNQRLGHGSAAAEIYSTFERDRVMTDGRVFATFRYFDPLFLAELIRTPVVFSAGLQDSICSAIGMTAAAHRIPDEFRVYILDPEGGHGGSPWIGSINSLAERLSLQDHHRDQKLPTHD